MYEVFHECQNSDCSIIIVLIVLLPYRLLVYFPLYVYIFLLSEYSLELSMLFDVNILAFVSLIVAVAISQFACLLDFVF